METAKRRDGLPLGIGLWILAAFLTMIGLMIVVGRFAPEAGPVAAPKPGAVGSIGRIEHGALWVDPAGQAAWDRAYANRDERGMQAAIARFEGLAIREPTRVRVTAREGDLVQVEMLEGPHVGRRGWGHPMLLAP